MFRLPKSVEVRDDTMREGLQIESKDISVDEKLRLLDALGDTGLEIISIGSFVSPKWTPQMACIDEIAERFVPARDLRSGSSSAQPERRHQYLLLRGPQVRGHPIRHFSRRFGWLPLLRQWQKRWARSNRRAAINSGPGSAPTGLPYTLGSERQPGSADCARRPLVGPSAYHHPRPLDRRDHPDHRARLTPKAKDPRHRRRWGSRGRYSASAQRLRRFGHHRDLLARR